MNDLTEINIYGQIAEEIGQNQWHLQVSSIREAFHAININSNRKFYKSLMDQEKRHSRYKILINERELDITNKDLKDFNEKDLNDLANQFRMERKIEKIDLVPVIEGGGIEILVMLIGAAISAAGIAAELTWLICIGVGLIMGGLALLLSKPPDFGQFREIQQVNHKDSYLFNGPVNYIGEGGPVPVGYGRLIVGSLGIQLNYFTEDKAAPVQDLTAPTIKSTVTEIVYDYDKPGFGPQTLSPITQTGGITPSRLSPIIR